MSHDSGLSDETLAGGTPDDEPTQRTIPERPQPGQRFMAAYYCTRPECCGKWDVYDWTDPGDAELEPEMILANLDEHDARLLVFGGDLLAACEQILLGEEILCRKDLQADMVKAVAMAREAIARIKGE